MVDGDEVQGIYCKSAVIQDVPISKPLSRAHVLDLHSSIFQSVAELCKPDEACWRAFNFLTSKHIDLHVEISTTLVRYDQQHLSAKSQLELYLRWDSSTGCLLDNSSFQVHVFLVLVY